MLRSPEGDLVLRLELARAESEPLAFKERLSLPPEVCGEEVAGVDPVELSGVVERAGRGFMLDGEISGAVRLTCSRCLKEFTLSFDEPVSVHLLPAALAPREEETQLGRDDLDVHFFDEPVVRLDELAAEQVALVVPIKPLCRETCQGLCPRCGADWNQGPCACPRTTDARWVPLLEWGKRG
jgi:uncharacterized protein